MENQTLDSINTQIQKEICLMTLESLSDKNLISTYHECPSVKKNIEKLQKVLQTHDVTVDQQDRIIRDYVLELVPPGTKGVIRGNKFNKLVEKIILELGLSPEKYEIKFEKKHPDYITSEIPDWYIYETDTKKIIIGMNQLDLWGGGQQINRGSKYLIQNKFNTEKSKLLCVVAHNIKIKSSKNKVYQIFKEGFQNKTLCYLGGLSQIIHEFFGVNV